MMPVAVENNRETFPTTQDVALFQSDGYVVSPRIIPSGLIEEALYGVQRYYAGERDWSLPISGGFLDWRPEHGEALRINDYVSLQNLELRKLVSTPELGRALALLAGADTIRLFHDQLICKPSQMPDKTGIGWHVDDAYWKTCSSSRMLTAWIPLSPYTVEMGPIMVIPKSHRWDDTDWMTTFNERDLESLEARFGKHHHGSAPVSILIEPGQVSFHHAKLIHGSRPNLAEKQRIALTVHVQDGDNRYQAATAASGRAATHVNDALCRCTAEGLPDYSDPDVCPVLWEKD